MHQSRVSTLMIDCLDDQFLQCLEFWSKALDLKPRRRPAAGERYVTLGEIQGPLFVRLQKVKTDPGFHLDIETNQVRSEVNRLKAAGARPKYRVRRWWVMEDASGNPFCVIRPESGQFPTNATTWTDSE